MKYHYVTIPRINGRQDTINIAEWVEQRGFSFVEYNKGGWMENCAHTVIPHLRFDSKEDAMCYILAHGGEYSATIPEKNSKINQ